MSAQRAIVEGRFAIAPILSDLARIPMGDPGQRRVDGVWWRAARTPEGPVTLAIREEPERVVFDAWGPGASHALARAGEWVGAHDDPSGFAPDHPRLAERMRGRPELRFGRTRAVVEHLIPSILGQRVTGKDAARSYRALCQRYGDPAPGPCEGLRLPPDPERLAHEPYYALHPIGVERTRARTLLNVAQRRGRLDALAAEPVDVASTKLQTLPGVGPWTAACVLLASHGDADAVPVGDFHLPNIVAWALADEPRADDARMLDLLAPYAGHRARAIRLVYSLGRTPPKYGPRVDTPDIRNF